MNIQSIDNAAVKTKPKVTQVSYLSKLVQFDVGFQFAKANF